MCVYRFGAVTAATTTATSRTAATTMFNYVNVDNADAPITTTLPNVCVILHEPSKCAAMSTSINSFVDLTCIGVYVWISVLTRSLSMCADFTFFHSVNTKKKLRYFVLISLNSLDAFSSRFVFKARSSFCDVRLFSIQFTISPLCSNFCT